MDISEIGFSGLKPSVDFAFLADAVQVVGGKLFALGGGWDQLLVRTLPTRHSSMGIGMRVTFPWGWDKSPVKVGVDLQDQDGRSVMGPRMLQRRIPVKQPSRLPPGSVFGYPIAFTFNSLAFKSEGDYSFVIHLDEEPVHRLRFTVRRRRRPRA